MTRDPGATVSDHGGELALAALRPFGVDTMYTLSGGHVFPFYDAAVKRDPPVRIVDVRHEQTATFAAEGHARLTRGPGLAVLTAGPGITNGMSAVTQVTRPKREALWKFPCPRMGDHETPELFFIA